MDVPIEEETFEEPLVAESVSGANKRRLKQRGRSVNFYTNGETNA